MCLGLSFQLRQQPGLALCVYGRRYGQGTEMMKLFEGEAIVQLSGKDHNGNYIQQLTLFTSRGRSLVSGQPYGASFNIYPTQSSSERMIR